MPESTNKELILLLALLLIFTVLFFISIINLRRGLPVFGIGISYTIENYIIIALSFLSILRIFWSIIKH
ncbi:MAG: hypothetical protein KAK00_04025 [Nanoarchaeota archaeon]|nr:hypothetical protein [Thermodesulfovibrionia bacterium]MCK5282550.1 hypothetical protein [Nanoarchaeota archaeon]